MNIIDKVEELANEEEEKKKEEEKRKNYKTNKRIVLDEEPVFVNVPIIEEDNDESGGSIRMTTDPTIPVPTVQESNEPQVQSGNITF